MNHKEIEDITIKQMIELTQGKRGKKVEQGITEPNNNKAAVQNIMDYLGIPSLF